jgi:Chalcone isomerase-like
MQINRAIAPLAGLALACMVLAAEVAGVKLEDKITIAPNAPELVLNGAGVRTRLVIKVYVARLYLTEKKTAAADVLALGGPKRMLLVMLRDVTAQQMSDAVNEGFEANNPPADQECYKGSLGELVSAMSAFGQVKKGDTLAFEYVPDTGTRVLLNGVPQGKSIAGPDFYRALLRVWLGEKPVDGELKKALLGHG